MNTSYKSEIGTGMVVLLAVSIVIVFLSSGGNGWVALFTFLFLFSYVFYLYRITRYEITDQELRVKTAFKSRAIPVAEITSIQSHYSFYNIPHVYALSERRLLVSYGNSQFVDISPRYRDSFIADLLALNATIEVEKSLSTTN